MTTIKTTLVKGAPWPEKPKKVCKPVNLDLVKKTRAPYDPVRHVTGGKYDELFDGIKAGDCFECPDRGTMEALSRALYSYFKRRGQRGIVRQSLNTADGVPRVWRLKIEETE